MNRLFTEIIPWFMEKIGWFGKTFSLKILLRGNSNGKND